MPKHQQYFRAKPKVLHHSMNWALNPSVNKKKEGFIPYEPIKLMGMLV
jgi:hypothetical protein